MTNEPTAYLLTKDAGEGMVILKYDGLAPTGERFIARVPDEDTGKLVVLCMEITEAFVGSKSSMVIDHLEWVKGLLQGVVDGREKDKNRLLALSEEEGKTMPVDFPGMSSTNQPSP